jgi:hypothetical protein
MNNTELRQFLENKFACRSAMDWLGERDSAQMWAECDRADWLLWWAGHTVPRQELVLAACDCAELALRFVPEREQRPRLAIETARRWARSEATVEEVTAAYAAAYAADAAAYAARAADAAAYAAARAADAAAYAAKAAAYAAKAAYAAARAADAAAYAAKAAYAAARAAEVQMCQLIRTRWPECPLPEVTA